MKKIVISMLALVALSLTVFADGRYIEYAQLPNRAKQFVSQYFAGVNVVYAEQDRDSYEVNLENGVEIEFRRNGEWESVDAKYSPLPTGFIPAAVLNSIKKEYPNANVIKIEKDWGGFEVELDNRMELKINNAGQIVRREYD